MRAETRHQLKQDAFSRVTIDAAEKTAHWTVEHRSTLIIGAVVAIVVLAAVIGGWYYLNTQDEKASLELSQAVRTMDTQLRPAGTPAQPDFPTFTSAKERAEAAKKQFQAIVDKYPHTRTADMAHYFLGVTAANLSDNARPSAISKRSLSAGNRQVVCPRQRCSGIAVRPDEPHQRCGRALSGTDQQADGFGQQGDGAVAVGRALSEFQPAARRQAPLRADQERKSAEMKPGNWPRRSLTN